MPVPLRVLMVEDSDDDVLLLARELSRGGYELHYQQVDTREGLELELVQPWDVVLLDYSMPHLSGIHALMAIRQKGLDIPVIIVSNAIGEDLAVTAMKAGAQDYVSKANLSRLLVIIEREMQEAAARRERRLSSEVDQRLQEMDLAILRGASLSQVLGRLCEGLTDVFAADLVWVILRDPQGQPQVRAWSGRGGVGGGTPQKDLATWMHDSRYLEELLGNLQLRLLRLSQPDSPAWGSAANYSGYEAAIVMPLEVETEQSGAICLFSQSDSMISSATVMQLDKISRQTSLAIRLSENQTRMRLQGAAMEAAAYAIFIVDSYGVIVWVNEAVLQMSGYSRDELLDSSPSILRANAQQIESCRQAWELVLRGEIWRGRLNNRRKNGELYSVHETVTPIRNEAGEISHFVFIEEDITTQLETQEKLYQITNFDALTGLPNRSMFYDRLDQSIAQVAGLGRPVGVLQLDLDHFKNINDTLGHEVGDALLWQVAERLRTVVQEPNTLSRQGGDEFGVLLPFPGNTEAVALMAQRLIEVLGTPFILSEREVYVSPSIGVALYPDDGQSADELLRSADTAMYRAKELGRNAYQFYTADMNARMNQRLTLESHLRRVIERDELALAYQPKADLKTGQFCGMEVLLRWKSAELGDVSPAVFIPVAEETGIIIAIGEWVMREACRQGRCWLDEGVLQGRIAVNVSGRQFDSGDLIEMVDRVLAETGFPAGHLELEVTESTIIRDPEKAIVVLAALGERGISVSIDDFGTGYSSLNYLKRLPIHTLKIDRSFVNDIGADRDGEAIVKAVIAMAHSLGLNVVAEGVETTEQAGFLREFGCNILQGYLFSRPLLIEAMEKWVRTHTPLQV